MNKWKNTTIGDLVELSNGKARPITVTGNIPVYGGNGILGYTDASNTTGESLIIGRVGAYCGSVYYESAPCWVSDNAIRAVPKIDNDTRFLYYALRHYGLNTHAEGSSHPLLTQGLISSLPINVPDIIEQRYISQVLTSLDDKIDLLHQQNRTLELMAETLYKRLYEKISNGSRTGTLSEMIQLHDSKRVPLSSLHRGKMKSGELYPYYGAAAIMDYVNAYLFDGDYLLLGEDGTVQDDEGYPVLQRANGKFWVNNHAHVLTAKPPYTLDFLEILLRNTNISHIVTGAVQPKISQGNLNSLEVKIPTREAVEQYCETVAPLFSKRKENRSQIQTLEKLRDTLLPKLMSGEIRVNDITTTTTKHEENHRQREVAC